ncbi:hypothetical protein VVD49_10490 [Uliginosibacterium sp. H3]|uniref:Uncharacterized protein n=1 Tax=Uliginosibacterium silvisoli TaxID=3114758 RepID=A0ABU6K3Y8_9RHOO|nr:hypothetical protein [Uliginosibacterium sp. H3]
MKQQSHRRLIRTALVASLLGSLGVAIPPASAADAPTPGINPAPTAKDWADISKLPDWSGVWLPDRKHVNAPFAGKAVPPWNEKAAKYIAEQQALEKAGKPNNIYIDCLPEGMPSFVVMTLNSSEFLFTPGRVTLLNEFDGNRTRRIYTDGRPHPEDPDLTFNGHSIGKWEGDTLVVDTVGIHPQTYIPIGQAVGIPNNGDVHIIERIHLVEKDRLNIDLEVHAPHVLREPWKITKSFLRSRERRDDIVEASCRQGDFYARVDPKTGNHVWVEIPKEAGGAPLPTARALDR